MHHSFLRRFRLYIITFSLCIYVAEAGLLVKERVTGVEREFTMVIE